MGVGNIRTSTKEIQRIIMSNLKKKPHIPPNWKNLKEMAHFLFTYDLPKLNQNQMNNLN